MKFYLSSQGLGNEVRKLKKLFPKNKKTAYIANAVDFSNDSKRRRRREKLDIMDLKSVGLKPEILDLRKYFGKKKDLENKIKEFGVIWVRGGNTFVLRQAMKLSGFDKILEDLKKTDMLYGGYSAGMCVLEPNFKGLELVDDPSQNPYMQKTIWKGLGIIDYMIVPHYKSDHPESADMDKVVEYYKKKKIKFKTLKDGEVIVIDKQN